MSSYKVILKTTGLFASLRFVTILLNIGTTKIIALILGASGVGLYGVFTSALNLITSIADLGISRSSVRSISEAHASGDHEKTVGTISLVSRLILITGALGGGLTILLSYYISIWSFGNSNYWFSFMLLGIAVTCTVIKNGQNAIFQGIRSFKIISKNTIYSAIISFLFSVPLVLIFKEQGVLYAIILTAIIGVVISRFYLNRISYEVNNKVLLSRSKSMEIIKLGLAMMLVSFLVALSGYLIRAFILKTGSLTDLGYFQAGFQIISGYFGLIFTSMTTDFFPRLSAISSDNEKVESEVNQQGTVTLLLIGPLVVILPFLMPFVIKLLYASEFTIAIEYVNIALFGIIFQAGSQTMGMVLLAKNNARFFTVSVFLFQTVFLVLNIVGYKYLGILGLGITFSINMLLHLIVMQIVNKKLYNITYNKLFFKTLFVILILALLSYLSRNLEWGYRVVALIVLVSLSLSYSMFSFKKLLNIESVLGFLKNKLNGKSKKND